MPAHWRRQLAVLLFLTLLLVGCGTATPGADVQTSPLGMVSPLPGATTAPTPKPTLPPTPTTAPTATPTATPLPASVQLVVLHTNDNWGEVDPCG